MSELPTMQEIEWSTPPRIQPHVRVWSKCGTWEAFTVCGGWLYTRYRFDITADDWIEVTTTFVPFPSHLQR